MSFKRLLTAAAVLSSSVLVGAAANSVNVSANTLARVVSLTTTASNGTYKVGDKIQIDVNFSEPVELTGGLSLLLETGVADRIARSEYGDQARTITNLSFSYTVQVGDRTSDLDVQSSSALLAGDSTVQVNGTTADLTLPSPGATGSLSASSDIVIDGRGVEEQWQSPFSSVMGLYGILLAEDIRENVSWLIEQGSTGPLRYCRSMDDAGCAGKNLEFRAVIPMCESATDVDCIAGVEGIGVNKKSQVGKLDSYFPKRGAYDFTGNDAAGLPKGTGTSIVRLSDFPFVDAVGEKHDTYAVTVSLTGMIRNGKVTGQTSVFASITPVTFRETTCDAQFNAGNEGVAPGTYVGGCMDGLNSGVAVDQDNGYRCILWDSIDGNGDGRIETLPRNGVSSGDKSLCALKQAFPKNVRFKIDARLRTEPVGWLHGRLTDPDITFTPGSGRVDVTIAGEPVAVPTYAGVATYEALPKQLQDYFDAMCERNCHSARFGPMPSTTPRAKRNLLLTPSYYSADAVKEMDLWRDFVADSAGSIPSNWNVRTLSGSEMRKAPECITKGTGVTGVVTTNATAYDEGPPTFDADAKTLKYKVAAPHYESDGKKEFRGNYHLRMRQDIAECLYKFSETLAVNTTEHIAEEEPYIEAVDAEDFSEATFEQTADAITPDLEQFEPQTEVDSDVSEAKKADLAKVVEYTALPDGTLGRTNPETEPKPGKPNTSSQQQPEPVRKVVASVKADVISSEQKAASAKTRISLKGGWFHFSATDFTFSQPTVAVELGTTPARSIRCVAGTSFKVVTGVKPSCPSGHAAAITRYCTKGKRVDAVIAAKPRCPKGFKTATAIRCAKGLIERRVIALSPKCPKAFKPMVTFVCMKGDQARKITSAVTNCASGWAKATTISCAKGKKSQSVTGLKPKCPKGFRKR